MVSQEDIKNKVSVMTCYDSLVLRRKIARTLLHIVLVVWERRWLRNPVGLSGIPAGFINHGPRFIKQNEIPS